MIFDFDFIAPLRGQCFYVSLVRQEQTHTLTLETNGGFMGKHIKDNHVPGIGSETLLVHNV